MTITPNSGTGPGAITPDGSPVEFYLLLEPREEPGVIAAVVPKGGSILELGSGVGRVTHPLVDLGYEVVAVDESAEMLAHVRGAATVCSSVQDLALGRRFDAVVLASYLVNTGSAAVRQAFLAACARHVSPGGSVLLQWQPAEIHDAWTVGRGRADGPMSVTLAQLDQPEPGLFAATMRYAYGERVWTQSFTSRRLSDAELGVALGEAGLALAEFLTEDRTWVRAVPVGQ